MGIESPTPEIQHKSVVLADDLLAEIAGNSRAVR